MQTLRRHVTLTIVATAAIVFASGDARAQAIPPALRGAAAGITVGGQGTVLVAPDRASVSVQIYGSVAPGGASALPGPSVPMLDAANGLRDAMKAAGIDDAAVVLPIGGFSTRNVAFSVTGSLAKPTRESLDGIGRKVVAALPDRLAAGLANANVQVVLIADDCAAGEARAERAAFLDARARAERIAAIAGIHLGPVVGITLAPVFFVPGCGTKPDRIEQSNGAAQFTLGGNGPIGLPVTINETVVFAIAGP